MSHPAVPVGKVSVENSYQGLKCPRFSACLPGDRGVSSQPPTPRLNWCLSRHPRVRHPPSLPPSHTAVLRSRSSPVPGIRGARMGPAIPELHPEPSSSPDFPMVKLNLTGPEQTLRLPGQDRHATPTLSHWAEQTASDINLGRVLPKAKITSRLKSLIGGENQQHLSFIICLSRTGHCSDETGPRGDQQIPTSTGHAYSRKKRGLPWPKPCGGQWLVTWLSRGTWSARGSAVTQAFTRPLLQSRCTKRSHPTFLPGRGSSAGLWERRCQNKPPMGTGCSVGRTGWARRDKAPPAPAVQPLQSEPARVWVENLHFLPPIAARPLPTHLSVASHACPTYTAPLPPPPRRRACADSP